MVSHVLVIGGAGRTGRKIVEKLASRGHAVRVLARYPATSGFHPPEEVEVMAGSITDAQTVSDAVKGMDSIVIIVESAQNDHGSNSPRLVHFEGTRHVLAAALPDTQIVLVTQIYITRPQQHPEIRSIIHWRGEAETAVRHSSLPYTIVRPGWLTDELEEYTGLHLEQGDTGEGQVSREHVAEVCVQALQYPEARGKTLEVYTEPGSPPQDWGDLFRSLQADTKGSVK